MDNKLPIFALVGICLLSCVFFALAGAWATYTLNTATDNAQAAFDAAMPIDDDTSQTARAVCVAGLLNLESCNISQMQTQTDIQPAAVANDKEQMDWLQWSAFAILGLAVICFCGLVAMALEPRQSAR